VDVVPPRLPTDRDPDTVSGWIQPDPRIPEQLGQTRRQRLNHILGGLAAGNARGLSAPGRSILYRVAKSAGRSPANRRCSSPRFAG